LNDWNGRGAVSKELSLESAGVIFLENGEGPGVKLIRGN